MGSEWAAPLTPITTPASKQARIERLLLLLLLVIFGAGMLAGLCLDWFVARMPDGQISSYGGVSELSIDLRSVSTCDQKPDMYCRSPLRSLLRQDAAYITLATMTFWCSLVFAGLVGFQSMSRLLVDGVHCSISCVGYLAGVLTAASAVATAYIYAPEIPYFTVEPALGPLVLVISCIVGIATLYRAAKPPTVETPTAAVPRARALRSRA